VYFQTSEFAKAHAAYSKVFEDFPNHRLAPHALFNSAVCVRQLGEPAKALAYFQRIRKDYPTHPLADEAALQAGVLLERTGRLEEALQAYDQATRLKNPKLAVEALFYHADALRQLKDYEKAVTEFNRLTKKYPKEDEWCVTAMAKVAECYEEQGKYESAEKEYRRILKYTGVKMWRDSALKRLKALEPYLKKAAPSVKTEPTAVEEESQP